jgi:hypothetical protein
MTRGRTARLAAAAAALPLVTGLLAAAPSSTATATGRPWATAARGVAPVLLSSISPASPGPADTLVLTGTVRNEGPAPITGLAVRLRISPTAVRSRAEIEEILAGTAGRTGLAVASTRTDVADVLAPGSSVRFRVSVPVAALDLPTGRNEVVVLGVESLGDVADDGQGMIQTGLTRTFLPWFPRPDRVVPTPLVWLFPLTSAPARDADGAFLDDHLATEVAPQGRLSRLLDAAEQAPAALSWVVDPALLQSLQAMGAGYRVRHPDGSSVEGGGGPAALAWLARLSVLSSSAEVTASAYGDPDVVALHRAGLDVDIALASTTARDLPDQLLAAPVGTGLAWPPDAESDDGTLDVLRASGAREVVLSAQNFPPSPPVTYTPTGSLDLSTGGSPLRAVLADPALSRLVAAPTTAEVTADPVVATPVERRQQALAQIAMTTLELPTTPRTLVIAPSAQWSSYAFEARDLVASVSTSSYARPERLGVLAALPPSAVPRARVDYPAAARAAELPQRFLALVGGQRHELAALRSVAPDVATSRSISSDALEQALTRSESAAWRTEPATGRRLLASATASITEQVSRVQVLSRAPVTLPGDSGTIPVTVANDLDRPARVGVRLSGTPAARFVAADIPPVTLAPGQKETLEVVARVIGTGPVRIDISLLTPEGQPFGAPVTTEVRSAAYARAAQGVVVGLFAVLVLLLGVNFVRRRRSTPVASRPTGVPGADGD